MKSILAFLRSTIVGGALFLLPLGIVLVVFGKLFTYAQRIATKVHDQFLPRMDSNTGPFLLAILLLLVMAFIAGAFLKTRVGKKLFLWLEDKILVRIPIYLLARQMIGDMAGGTTELISGPQTKVVLVELDDMTVVGFMVERGPKGKAIVYLPGAPSALSGSVALIDQNRITETGFTPAEIMASMRRLGSGLVALEHLGIDRKKR